MQALLALSNVRDRGWKPVHLEKVRCSTLVDLWEILDSAESNCHVKCSSLFCSGIGRKKFYDIGYRAPFKTKMTFSRITFGRMTFNRIA